MKNCRILVSGLASNSLENRFRGNEAAGPVVQSIIAAAFEWVALIGATSKRVPVGIRTATGVPAWGVTCWHAKTAKLLKL